MTVFRSFTSKDDELDGEGKGSKDGINKWNGTYDDEAIENTTLSNTKPVNEDENIELKKARLKQSKINKCHKILREIAFNFMFIWVLLVVAYVSRNSNAFNYQTRTRRTFGGYNDVRRINFFLLFCPFIDKMSIIKAN